MSEYAAMGNLRDESDGREIGTDETRRPSTVTGVR